MRLDHHYFSMAIAAIMLLFFSSQAVAHAAIVWAYAENDRVFVEAFFANGTKIQNTKIVVIDENEKVLLEGKTDKEGKFNYRPTTNKKQTVLVISGESHLGDFELTEEDLSQIKIVQPPPK
jgi:nickel transport protein